MTVHAAHLARAAAVALTGLLLTAGPAHADDPSAVPTAPTSTPTASMTPEPAPTATTPEPAATAIPTAEPAPTEDASAVLIAPAPTATADAGPAARSYSEVLPVDSTNYPLPQVPFWIAVFTALASGGALLYRTRAR